jgi:hypothetical protein
VTAYFEFSSFTDSITWSILPFKPGFSSVLLVNTISSRRDHPSERHYKNRSLLGSLANARQNHQLLGTCSSGHHQPRPLPVSIFVLHIGSQLLLFAFFLLETRPQFDDPVFGEARLTIVVRYFLAPF